MLFEQLRNLHGLGCCIVHTCTIDFAHLNIFCTPIFHQRAECIDYRLTVVRLE